jgi:hypothetical protein
MRTVSAIGPDFLVTNDADMFVGPHAHARGADRWVVVGARVTGGTRRLVRASARRRDRQRCGDGVRTHGLRARRPAGTGRGVQRAARPVPRVVHREAARVRTRRCSRRTRSAGRRAGRRTVRLGPDFIHRARVTSIGTTGYAIAYWDFPFIGDPRTFVIRVDAAGEPIDGAPTVEIAGYVPSIVQQCGTAQPIVSWWSFDPTDVVLKALDATGLTATACLEVSGESDG